MSLARPSLYFRINGGLIWTRPGEGPLAAHMLAGWKYQNVLWSGLRFQGPCRLVFGVPRDPVGASEQLQSVSIEGRILSASGVPIATYEPRGDMWHGAAANIWWHAFRVESVELRESVAIHPHLQPVIGPPASMETAAGRRLS